MGSVVEKEDDSVVGGDREGEHREIAGNKEITNKVKSFRGFSIDHGSLNSH